MDFKNIFFVGIGGIGMSALARYFKAAGKCVAGYDRTATALTAALESEGIDVTYADDASTLAPQFRSAADTLVVFTPAVPAEQSHLTFFRQSGHRVLKRAQVLGLITDHSNAICIAGTHGKTTTSTLTAHIMRQSEMGCSAFLGGISNNYQTNFWSNPESDFVVTEADEFDRSFLTLHPFLALITAMDADHLDIYGTADEVRHAFGQFARLIVAGGSLVYKLGLPIDEAQIDDEVEIFTYSLKDRDADFHAFDIRQTGDTCTFGLETPMGSFRDLTLGVPGLHNVENAVAACALTLLAGADEDDLRRALPTFAGNWRRFQYRIRRPDFVMIDDYAHHPEEIRTMLTSVRRLYPKRRITVVFQPHLYTRTRDFADGFAASLSLADRVLLLDIYPAREQPIEGVSSAMLAGRITVPAEVVGRSEVADRVCLESLDVLVMMGAGNIDTLVPEVERRLLLKIGNV